MEITLPTHVCNLSLSRIGAKRLKYSDDTETDLAANTTLQAIQCNLHYEQTVLALLRSNWWTFARKRKALVRDTETPPFEFTYQYVLPDDYLRPISIWENRFQDDPLYGSMIEDKKLLSNNTEVNLRYVRKVTNVTEFDPLFIEVLVLVLAKKLFPPLGGTKSATFMKGLKKDITEVTSKARVINKQEQNTAGRDDLFLWNDARYNG